MEKLWQMLLTNVGTKLISIAIAVVLWFVVLGSRNVEATKEIPLEVITPADIIPANEIPEKIAFRLSGPKAFLRAVLDRREDPIRVNLSGAKPGLVTYRFFSDNIRLPIGVKVLSINPTAILIKLEYLKRREVPVRPVLRGAPPEGYRVARSVVKPETVRIKGAESRVDGVTEVQTTPVDISGIRQSLEKEVALDIARYSVQLDSPMPHLFVDVEAMSANFRIKNVDIRVLSSYKVRLDEKAVTVLVRADQGELKSLDRSKVYAVVDLKGMPKGRYLRPVKVMLPEELGLVKVIPDKVNVTLY
ncbi:MAG: CdaR family protein [Oligoflexia bacterium]|nr:CdaR family protein [Oligoflexia bacterium]